MRALLIEDEPLARREMRLLLEAHPEIEVVGDAGSPNTALTLIQSLKPELLFLDVNLRGGSGLELLASMARDRPKVIFTTAYSDFAIQAFDFDAIDYLVKPIRPERLAQALRKLEMSAGEMENAAAPCRLSAGSRIFLRDQEKSWFVSISEIVLIESEGNHSRILAEGATTLIHRSLSLIEERLPLELFFRANRAQLINLEQIRTIEPWFSNTLRATLSNGVVVEFSRRASLVFRETRGI
jgi:two-component system LytT family response regulator